MTNSKVLKKSILSVFIMEIVDIAKSEYDITATFKDYLSAFIRISHQEGKISIISMS